jgi:hypothetical protein
MVHHFALGPRVRPSPRAYAPVSALRLTLWFFFPAHAPRRPFFFCPTHPSSLSAAAPLPHLLSRHRCPHPPAAPLFAPRLLPTAAPILVRRSIPSLPRLSPIKNGSPRHLPSPAPSVHCHVALSLALRAHGSSCHSATPPARGPLCSPMEFGSVAWAACPDLCASCASSYCGARGLGRTCRHHRANEDSRAARVRSIWIDWSSFPSKLLHFCL